MEDFERAADERGGHAVQHEHKAFMLQTRPAQDEHTPTSERLAKAAGFSLHAGVAAEPWERNKLQRLARYLTRPAIAEQRLALTAQGLVRYELKTPYRDGTTHVFFEPLDLMARLAALIPKPRVNLIRFDGEHPCSPPFGQPSVVQIYSR